MISCTMYYSKLTVLYLIFSVLNFAQLMKIYISTNWRDRTWRTEVPWWSFFRQHLSPSNIVEPRVPVKLVWRCPQISLERLSIQGKPLSREIWSGKFQDMYSKIISPLLISFWGRLIYGNDNENYAELFTCT